MAEKQKEKNKSAKKEGEFWVTFGAGTGPFPHKKNMYSVPLKVIEKHKLRKNKLLNKSNKLKINKL